MKTANNISVYLPIKNEVETKMIIGGLISKGKRIFLPSSSPVILSPAEPGEESLSYFFAEFTGWDHLEKGPYGILQPDDSESIIFGESIDVSIIPGVAFDKRSVRLGWGKGVFDKLLADSSAFKIGLAYEFQMVDEIPKEKHDLIMDLIVTDKRIAKFT